MCLTIYTNVVILHNTYVYMYITYTHYTLCKVTKENITGLSANPELRQLLYIGID